MQNAVAICHLAFEDAGTLEPVLKERGIDLRYLQAGVDDLSPAKDADLVLVLGGPIGIYEFERYPFLIDELAIVEAVVEDLALTVHPHPTFSEALMEAAEDYYGHAIHLARRSEGKR